jgi:uncharacterized membrane protein YkvA (DUF1232 family)
VTQAQQDRTFDIQRRQGAMSPESLEKRFVQRMRQLLVSLPYDMKVLFEAVSDENLPPEVRQLAAVAVIYCISPSDPMPDTLGLIGYIDDVVYVRMALKRILELGGEDTKSYPDRFVDELRSLDEDLELVRGYLGDSIDWIARRMDRGAGKVRYKGKAASTYVDDDEAREFLYEEGQDFATAYEIDEKAAAKLQNGKPILDAFRRRMAEESKRLS